MDFSVLLPQAPQELRSRLQRLINQSLNCSNIESKALPIWRPAFFHVENSVYWNRLREPQQSKFLRYTSKSILKEAISIEHAGIAYANKMALLSESQEERQYYTTVAYEELNHLILLKPYFEFQLETETPAFSQMIADLIEKENRKDSIILIQVLLEGWGIHHYQSLSTGIDDHELKSIFSKIIFDETRHHGGGVILSQHIGVEITSDLIEKIQIILDAVRIGPFQTGLMLSHLNKLQTAVEIKQLLISIQAFETTMAKIKIVQQNLCKIIPAEQLQSFNWTPFSLIEMSQAILNSLESLKSAGCSKEVEI